MAGAVSHGRIITDEFSLQVSGLIDQILAEMKKLKELGYSSPTLSITLASIDRTADMQSQLYELMEEVRDRCLDAVVAVLNCRLIAANIRRSASTLFL